MMKRVAPANKPKISAKNQLRTIIAISLLALTACSETALKADIQRGEILSQTCSSCHGEKGISKVPIYPTLAGQIIEDLALKLNLFRSGERVNELMTPYAQGLSDQDIADLSAYYAQFNPKAE
jgi:cytochrome c553